MTISKETARDFLVNYQDLNDMRGLEGYEGALAYMQRVRCIQYDPLDVVGRNADLVLQSRIKNYAPKMLQDLLYKDRALIDAVDKVLSIIPVNDYLPMTRMRKTASDDLVRILGYRGSLDALDVADSVVEHIRINGPQPASKIDIGGRAKDGSWGHRKISSAALDYLYHSGRLGIRTKINTQKVYDLMERLFPEDITHGEDPFPDENEFLKWYVLRRIGSIGMVWDRNTGAWIGYHIQNAHPRTEIIHELVDDGRLTEVRIEGSEETYYIRSEDEGLLGVPADRNKVSFIAPLDNFIWDREMTEEIFGFRYRWEVYTPAAKRQYGYYVLPVLYKNSFIARVEFDKHRGTAPLCIKHWWWEPHVTVNDDMLAAVRDALHSFSTYLGAEDVDDDGWMKEITT